MILTAVIRALAPVLGLLRFTARGQHPNGEGQAIEALKALSMG